MNNYENIKNLIFKLLIINGISDLEDSMINT
jgi:hypothetical protein